MAAYIAVFFGALPALLWQLGGLIDAALRLPPLASRFWPVAGAVLTAAGLALMGRAMVVLRTRGGGWPITHLPPPALVDTGPYARMRHPIYVGYTLAFAGAGTIAGSIGRAVGATAVLTAAWIAYALLLEEPRLWKRHGARSRAYRESSSLLPGGRKAGTADRASDRPPGGSARHGTGPLLTARHVAKRYGRRPVLTDAGLSVRPGELIGITGENGAGKSTLLRVLAGVLRPDGGTIERPATMGYAPQEPLLYEQLTPWEHFRYFAAARGLDSHTWRSRAEALIARYRFEQWRDDRSANLSGGTRQKLNLALAWLPDPALLLLDEPYGGFEWSTYLSFWDHVDELRERGRALVVVSHLFHERDRFDRLLDLRDGRLVEAT